jgi:hypothetical protein
MKSEPMTEAGWQACADPRPMLEYLMCIGRESDRKLRLFAVACCRRIWALMSQEKSRWAIQVAEAFADGYTTPEALARQLQQASEPLRGMTQDDVSDPLVSSARAAVWTVQRTPERAFAAAHEAARAVALRAEKEYWDRTGVNSPVTEAPYILKLEQENWAQCHLVRDLSGNPFRPLPILGSSVLTWNDGLIVQIANAVYDDRVMPSGEFERDRVVVLADALEEAGAPTEMVTHLRGPGPHVRGCHVLDLCLGLS